MATDKHEQARARAQDAAMAAAADVLRVEHVEEVRPLVDAVLAAYRASLIGYIDERLFELYLDRVLES